MVATLITYNLIPFKMLSIRNLLQLLLNYRNYLIFVMAIFIFSGCTYNLLFWERNIWTEFDGVFVIEEPDDLDKYAELLPEMFNMPKIPMVGMFCADYFDTEHWPMTLTKYLTPYLESAIFITCQSPQKNIGRYGETGNISAWKNYPDIYACCF